MPGRRRTYYKRKMYFSREDRILLHLLGFVGYEGQIEQPDELTQFGIAAATGLGRSTVSKTLRAMISRGLITSQRAHVPSGRLRRTVYLLTRQGVSLAQERQTSIENEVVLVCEESGTTRKLPLKEIPRQLPVYASTLEMAVHISEGKFDVESFLRKADQKTRFVDFTERMPKLRYFFGRSTELRAIDEWMKSRKALLLAVTGLPGTGKTTLLMKRLEDWRKRTNVFWYRVLEWTTPRNLLRGLAQFLDRLDRRELANYMAAVSEIDFGEIEGLLEKDMNGLNALLVFDDCHNASSQTTQLLHSLRLVLDRISGPKVIVAGRRIPAFYNRRDVKVNGFVNEIDLGGLDRENSQRLLALRNVDISQPLVDRIFEITQGHPMFLELVDPIEGTGNPDIAKFLEEDLVSRLSAEDLTMLELASVFRYPVAARGLTFGEGAARGSLKLLVEQSLLKEASVSSYEVHDLLREFFRQRIPSGRRKRYEAWAAEYHLSLGTEEDALEAVYHFFEAGDDRSAVELLAKAGSSIARKGHTEDLDALLRRAETVKVPAKERLDLLLLRGEILSCLAEWEGALGVYDEVIELAQGGGAPWAYASALKAIGDIHLRRHERGKAMKALKTSLSAYKDVGDAKGLSAVHFSLGFLHESNGYVDRALRHYRRASRLVKVSEDPQGLVQYLFAYARILGIRGEIDKSLRLKKEALAVAERSGNLHEIARITIAIGNDYYNRDQVDEGLAKFWEGTNLAKRIGNQRLQAYGLMNMASAMLKKRSFAVAEANLSEARRIFEKLGERVSVGLCEIDMGFLEERRGNWELSRSHLLAGLRMLRENHSPIDLLNSSMGAGMMFMKHGEFREATEILSSARNIAKRIGRIDLVRRVDLELVSIRRTAKPGSSGVGVRG